MNVQWNTHKDIILPFIGLSAATSLIYQMYQYMCPPSIFKLKKGTKEIPTPDGAVPYFGHFFQLEEVFCLQIERLHKQLGKIFGMQVGVCNWVFINDPKMIYQLFVKNGQDTSSRAYTSFGYKHYGHGGRGIIFAPAGQRNKKARGAALQVLAPKHVETYLDVIYEEADALVSRLIEATEKEGSVYPLKYVNLNSLNVMYLAGFGKRFTSVEDPEFVAVSNIIANTMRLAGPENDPGQFLPILSGYDAMFGKQAQMKDHIENERNPVYRKSITEALEREGPNMVKSLKETNYELEDDDILVIMSDMLIGGMDTSSVALLWLLPILAIKQDVQDRARAEVDAFVATHHRLPAFDERHETPYCFGTIREVLRYRAVTPFGTPHYTSKDVEIDGYIIPAGTTVFTCLRSIHSNPEMYADPDEFKPERFMHIEKSMMAAAQGKLEERDHFSFGWGRRICPGIYLAENELYAAMVHILHRSLIKPSATLPDIHTIVHSGLMGPPLPYTIQFVTRSLNK